jgi:hypothetical protein
LLIRFCSLLQHICCWSDSVRCCGISYSRINLSVVVRNPTPVGHPILFVVQACLLLIRFCWFCGISVVDLVLFVVPACLLLIRLCSLLGNVCYWSGFVCCCGMSVRCCCMSVIDSVLFVVTACLLLIWFCSLFRHVWSVVDSILLLLQHFM